eukprot:scaffold1661_cov183-Chaetoceros_neogracile.AAC.3
MRRSESDGTQNLHWFKAPDEKVTTFSATIEQSKEMKNHHHPGPRSCIIHLKCMMQDRGPGSCLSQKKDQ